MSGLGDIEDKLLRETTHLKQNYLQINSFDKYGFI